MISSSSCNELITKIVDKYEIFVELLNQEQLFVKISSLNILPTMKHEPNSLSKNYNNKCSSKNPVNSKNLVQCEKTILAIHKLNFEQLITNGQCEFQNMTEVYEAFDKCHIADIKMEEKKVQIKFRTQKQNKFCKNINLTLPPSSRITYNTQVCQIEYQKLKQNIPLSIVKSQNIKHEYERLPMDEQEQDQSLRSADQQDQKDVKIQIDQKNLVKKQQIKMQNQLLRTTQKNKKLNKHFPGTPIEFIKYNPSSLLRLSFYFSENMKQNDLKVNNSTKVYCNSTTNNQSFKAIKIRVVDNERNKNKNVQAYRIDIKINKMKDYIILGLCNKTILQEKSYQFIWRDFKKLDSYLLDSDGTVWSKNESQSTDISQNKHKRKFFRQDDIVQIFLYPEDRKILFSKSHSSQSKIIEIGSRNKFNKYCFCVFLQHQGDQVEIAPLYFDLD